MVTSGWNLCEEVHLVSLRVHDPNKQNETGTDTKNTYANTNTTSNTKSPYNIDFQNEHPQIDQMNSQKFHNKVTMQIQKTSWKRLTAWQGIPWQPPTKNEKMRAHRQKAEPTWIQQGNLAPWHDWLAHTSLWI